MNDSGLYDPLSCVHPTCSSICRLPSSGRPGAFCSVTCRSKYYRRREELTRELDCNDAAIPNSPKRDRPALRRRRKALRFRLMRYPVIQTAAWGAPAR